MIYRPDCLPPTAVLSRADVNKYGGEINDFDLIILN